MQNAEGSEQSEEWFDSRIPREEMNPNQAFRGYHHLQLRSKSSESSEVKHRPVTHAGYASTVHRPEGGFNLL